MVHDDDVVLAAVAGHGLQVLRPVRRTVDADAAWLRLTVEREAMRCVLPVPPGIENNDGFGLDPSSPIRAAVPTPSTT